MCPSEVSDIQSTVARDYADDGLVVWAIATTEGQDAVQRWVDAFDVTLPVLLDVDGSVTAQYEQTMAFPTGAYPQEWVIGTDGVIEYYANTFEVDALRSVIESELAGD